MKIKNQVTIQRLVGKVDNDFNISESDWIPRAGAWVIDALSQMKCLPMERKRRTLEVSDKLATFPCELNAKEVKVYDRYGCEIPELNDKSCCGSNITSVVKQEIGVTNNPTPVSQDDITFTVVDGNDSDPLKVFQLSIDKDNNKFADRTVIAEVITSSKNHNFVLSGNTIELNFDTDFITVETYEVATYYDDYYECDVPYIYDNGLLLEALAWYILFKYLSRGSHHPIYSLTSNNPVTNPFTQWNTLRTKAANSVKIELNKGKDDGWRNFFYNSTFDPRR